MARSPMATPSGLPKQDFSERSSMPRMTTPHPAAKTWEAKGSMRNTDAGMASKQTASNRHPRGTRGSGDQS